MDLTKESLVTIEGGISKTSKWTFIGFIVGGIITTIIGIIDGYKRPLPCNK